MECDQQQSQNWKIDVNWREIEYQDCMWEYPYSLELFLLQGGEHNKFCHPMIDLHIFQEFNEPDLDQLYWMVSGFTIDS